MAEHETTTARNIRMALDDLVYYYENQEAFQAVNEHDRNNFLDGIYAACLWLTKGEAL